MFRIYTKQPFSVILVSIISQVGKKIRIIHSGVWLFLAVPLWLTTKAIAPILSLKVIRPQWKKLPDPQQAGNLLQNSPLVTVL